MRLDIYFQADGTEWWSEELRTYDGNADGDWVTFTGDFFRTPMGTAATGVFDETATDAENDSGITSRLHIEGLRLQAFLALGPGGVDVPTSSTQPSITMDVLAVPPPLTTELER